MKNSIKFLSIVLTITAMSFTSCKQDDCHDGPKPDSKDCNTELIFQDPGMCGGAFFKTLKGEYLEVYGYPVDGLTKGDRVQFGYEKFDKSNLIECKALSAFEGWLYDNGHTAQVVKVRKECIKTQPDDCNTELEFMDHAVCSGAWFKTKNGEYLEVWHYPTDGLNKGDIVKFDYEDYPNSPKLGCAAISPFEIWLRENNLGFKTVKVKDECLKSKPWCGTGVCDTEVTYYKKDFCSGDLLKTEDGKLLRAFGLPHNNYTQGERLTIGYQPKTLQNDCQYVRQPDEMGEPVDITCYEDERGNEKPNGCSTTVTYVKRDICSGELLKTDDGVLLRAFDLHLTNIQLVAGMKYTINYEPMMLQNDCAVERPHNEIGKPVKVTCFNGNNIKE